MEEQDKLWHLEKHTTDTESFKKAFRDVRDVEEKKNERRMPRIEIEEGKKNHARRSLRKRLEGK